MIETTILPEMDFLYSLHSQEDVEKARHAAAHRACRPLTSPFKDLLPGDLT